ncbi:MAG: O-antigen ligase family protein [Patescibacteria group bacterium]
MKFFSLPALPKLPKFPEIPRINFYFFAQIFFGSGIFLLPLRLRSLVHTGSAYDLGFFNEYAAAFISLSEVLFLLAFLFLGLTFAFQKDFQPQLPPIKKYTYPLLALFVASVLVIPWATDPLLALLNFWRMLLLAAVALAIALRIFNRYAVVKILAAAVFLQAGLGIAQYLAEGGLGVALLGESFFTADTFNVAKIVLPGGEIALRGMGTLPHANIFGGLLAVTLLLLAAHPRKSAPLYFATIVILTGLFFSFSRAAYLAFFLGLFVLVVFQFKRRLVSALASFSIFGILLLAFGDPFFVRINEGSGIPPRSTQIYQALMLSRENPLGVGQGGYVASLAELNPDLEFWQLQPVHNFFALKLAEESLAVVLAWLAIFALLAFWSLKEKKFEVLALLVTVFLLMNFDHYFADNFTATAVLWIGLGFAVGALAEEDHEFKKSVLTETES